MKIISTISLFLFLIFWEVLARMSVIDITFFPAPSTVLTHTFYLFQKGTLLSDTAFSLKRLFISTLIVVPISVFLAFLSSRFKLFNAIFNPFVYLSYPLPKIALFPLILVLFGIDDLSKIILISIGMFFPVFIQTSHSLNLLFNSRLSDLVKIFNIRGWRFYFNFVFKGILSDFLIGLTNSLNYGLTLVIISESSVSKNGLGNGLWSSWDQFRIEDMYSYVFIISLIGLIINIVLQKVINSRKNLIFNY